MMWERAPVPLCLVPVKFEQQPVLWCQGLLGVRTGIIEQRVADGGSWHWEQTDVAIIKKYTTFELNMKSGGSKNGGWWRLCLRSLANNSRLLWVEAALIGQLLLWRESGELSQIMLVSKMGFERCDQKPFKKNFLQEDSCSEHTVDSLFRGRGSLDTACYVKVF